MGFCSNRAVNILEVKMPLEIMMFLRYRRICEDLRYHNDLSFWDLVESERKGRFKKLLHFPYIMSLQNNSLYLYVTDYVLNIVLASLHKSIHLILAKHLCWYKWVYLNILPKIIANYGMSQTKANWLHSPSSLLLGYTASVHPERTGRELPPLELCWAIKTHLTFQHEYFYKASHVKQCPQRLLGVSFTPSSSRGSPTWGCYVKLPKYSAWPEGGHSRRGHLGSM